MPNTNLTMNTLINPTTNQTPSVAPINNVTLVDFGSSSSSSINSDLTPVQNLTQNLKSKIVDLDQMPEKEIIGHAVNPLLEEDVTRIKNYFLTKQERYSDNNLRDYALVVIGLNLWLRISDLVKLKVQDVTDKDGNVVDSVIIHEQKTGKINEIPVNQEAKEAIVMLINTKEDWELEYYLFQNYKTKECITRNAAWKIIKKAEKELNLNYSIGTHTLRKTGAALAIQKNPNNNTVLYMVQERLNHSRPEQTMTYTKQHRRMMSEFAEKCGI